MFLDQGLHVLALGVEGDYLESEHADDLVLLGDFGVLFCHGVVLRDSLLLVFDGVFGLLVELVFE